MNENLILFITNLGVLALCGGLFMLLPYLTRKSYLFGVKIPADKAADPAATALKRRYKLTCLLGTLALLLVCVLQYIMAPDITLIAVMYLPLLIIPVMFAAFVPNWKRALALKAERGWQVSAAVFADTSSSHTRGTLSAMPWGWYIVSLVLVVATFVFALARYPHLPDMIPAHLDGRMQATRYAPKTMLSVLTMPLFNLGMLAIMLPVGVMIEKAKLQIDPNNPRVSFIQHRVYRRRMGNAMGFLTLGLVVMFAIIGVGMLYTMSPGFGQVFFGATLALSVLPVVVLMVVVVKTGQGGGKVKVDLDENAPVTASAGQKAAAYSGDDKYWKLGMFYYNPDDPAVIVEDRFGTNLGFNYGRLPVKIGAALFGAGFVGLYVWLTVVLVGM